MALASALLMPLVAEASHIPTVGMGTTGSFAILAGQGVTNTGPTVVKGDVGSDPNPAVTGFPPGTVTNGTINPSYTAGAKTDLITAYNDAAGRTPVTTIATDLGGQNLVHGVYDSASGTFGNSGTVILDAQGDANAVWVFKMASTLITSSASNVSLINGANPCNIFWQVGSSATLGTGSTLRGNILALTSITLTTNATLIGRALARNGSVTLDTNTVDASACLTAAPSPSPSPTASPSPSPTASPSPSPTASTSASPTASTSPSSTQGSARKRTTAVKGVSTSGGSGLPFTGGGVATWPGLAVALTLILTGLAYVWLERSSTGFAEVLRGYVPKRRRKR